ncbi:hypothetical protein ACHAXH_010044 [Discostella pseudostelligera]
MALHLYIPPMSCHGPSFWTLLPNTSYAATKMALSRRRYSLSQLLVPLFTAAETQAKQRVAAKHAQQTNPQSDPPRSQQTYPMTQTFFHLQHHPLNPPTNEIKQLWHKHIMSPPEGLPINHLTNHDGFPISIDKLTLAFS